MAGYSSMDDEMAGYSSMSDDDFGDDIAEIDTNPSEPIGYIILDASEIKKRQNEKISQVSATLSLTIDQSCILLYHYNWDHNTAQEAWCTDENNVRIATGLLEPVAAVPTMSKKHTCGICFDKFDPNNMEAAACRHLYCAECWEGYIVLAINEVLPASPSAAPNPPAPWPSGDPWSKNLLRHKISSGTLTTSFAPMSSKAGESSGAPPPTVSSLW